MADSGAFRPCDVEANQWRHQRSKAARSFRGQKILQPGHLEAIFPRKKLTTFL